MTLSFWLDESTEDGRSGIFEEADVAIIGGGIIGAGCAYLLAKKDLKVVLFEAGSLASGASGRNAGFVLRGIQAYYNQAVDRYGREKAASIFRFAEENQRLLKEFQETTGADISLDQCGSYLLASSLDELIELEKSARLMEEDGFKVEYLKEDPIDRGFYGALFNSCDFAVNPVKLVRALIAKSPTVTVFEMEEVSSIRAKNNGGRLVIRTGRRKIACEKVLVAINAYAPLMHASFKDKLKVMRGQILVTKPLRKRILESICYANFGYEYFRQLPDGSLLLGGCRQFFLDEETGYGDTVTRNVQSALENYIKNHFSDFAGIPIEYRFSGLMAFTPDGLPLVGEFKKIPGVYYALGCNGHGLGYGLNMSRLLTDVALNDKDSGIFSGDRPLPLNDAIAIES